MKSQWKVVLVSVAIPTMYLLQVVSVTSVFEQEGAELGPLHVFWQVSFGCLVTRSISSPLSQIWVMGSRTTEAWSFCKVNALNPLKFTSHKKNWKKKCLLFNLANFWMIKSNCQVQNSFFWLLSHVLYLKLTRVL